MVGGLIRPVALFLSFAFGVIGMSVGINALIKSNDLKDFVREHAPPGVTVHIDTSEAFDPGVVLAVGCGLLAISSFLTFLVTFFRPHAHKPRFASAIHFFWVVWIFASLVAFDAISRNKDAKVEAFLGGQQLPDSIVQQQEQALGVSRTYWDHKYIKLLAILPWFTFLFGTIAGVVLCSARARKDTVSTAAVDAEGGALRTETRETEKPEMEKRESVDQA